MKHLGDISRAIDDLLEADTRPSQVLHTLDLGIYLMHAVSDTGEEVTEIGQSWP